MKRCPHCGRQYNEEYSFCLDDGSALLGVSLPNLTPTEVIPRQRGESQPTRSILPAVIIALLAVTVAGLGAYILIPRSSQNEGDNFQTVNGGKQVTETPTTTAIKNTSTATNVAPTQQSVASPAGRWTGDWSAPSGAYLGFDLTLNDTGSNNVSGQIDWTLRRTTRPEKMSKIGMTAIEYVSGRFDPASSTVFLKGYRKDDPNNVLVMLDDYRLKLSTDGRRLDGQARNGGKWNGKINLSK